MSRAAYVVRHGKYDRHPDEHLIASGIAQAQAAGQLLLGKGVLDSAIILSSSAPRAVQTAEIICETLGCSQVYASPLVEMAGMQPEIVDTLREIADLALRQHEVVLADDQQLVIVAHEPLVAAVSGRQYAANGEVVEFDLDTWRYGD